MSIIAFYFSVSFLLKIVFSIDILIPCLWKTFFHVECPGCGLTRAFIEILQLNIIGAYKTNLLVFIILPVGVFYLYFDFVNFKRKRKAHTHSNR